MVRGLYTAATGMNVQAKRLEIISNDLANTTTTGYKKDVAVVSSFQEVLMNRLNDTQNQVPNNGAIGKMTYGAKIDEVYTDFTQGSIISTGEMVDMAIVGDGFFVVQTPNGEAYTRDGNFTINEYGELVTKEGYAVMGLDGPITLGEDFLSSGGDVIIDTDGEMSLDNQYIDTLELVRFEDSRALRKMDNNLYSSTAAKEAFTGSVRQGYLESANVNPVTAMVDMIAVSRAYETNQKMIQVQDSLLSKAVNELGRS